MSEKTIFTAGNAPWNGTYPTIDTTVSLAHEKRELLLKLWLLYRAMSDNGEMSEEDLKVWGAITNHSVIKSTLK